MATLVDTYKAVKRAIVAFCPKYIPVDPKSGPPLFPPIIGTGFVVREDGLIVTNDHVVRAFAKAFRPPDVQETDWGVYAMLLHSVDAGQVEIPLEVLGAATVGAFKPGAAYYGPPRPDVAFVHVKARGLPTLDVAPTDVTDEGRELATAGYPMGVDALVAPGYVHQVTPTLQRGIASAVLPYSCETPHAFTINVMTQGGASGSPVFDPETGQVLGVLYAGLNDIDVTNNNDVYRVPTNISYAVPAHYIRRMITQIEADGVVVAPEDTRSISDMLSSTEVVDVIEKGRTFEIVEVKPRPPVTNSVRLTEVRPVSDPPGSDAPPAERP